MRAIGVVFLVGLIGAALGFGCGGGTTSVNRTYMPIGPADSAGLVEPSTAGAISESGVIIPTPPGDAEAFNPMDGEERRRATTSYANKMKRERDDKIAEYIRALTAQPESGPDGQPVPENVEAAKRTRIEAAVALRKFGDVIATPFLAIQSVEDRDQEVRLACLDALGALQDYAAMPVIIPLLGDRDQKVAEAAMSALNGIMRGPEIRDTTHTYDFLGGRNFEARQRTVKKWRKWWDWWLSEGRKTAPERNGEREVPRGGEGKKKIKPASPVAEVSSATLEEVRPE